MAELPLVPFGLKLKLTYTISTDTVNVNTIHFKWNGIAPDNTAMIAWVGQVATSWTTNCAPLCHPSVSLTETRANDMSKADGGLGVNTGVHAGTRAGTALPAGTCALANYTIQRRYRGGKPRTYLPFGIELDILDGQHWKTTSIASFQTGWQTFCNSIASTPPAGITGMSLAQVSYYKGFEVIHGPTGRAYNKSTLNSQGPILDPLLSSVINPRFASQRRRNRP